MYNCSYWIEDTDPITLKENFTNLLNKCGFNTLDTVEHHFKPQGFTMLFLLSESHLAIHTFPEEGKTYIELSSCIERPFTIFKKKLK